MEELQDAIEDAQFLNAISSQDDGPRPVVKWQIPTAEQLQEWKAGKQVTFEWTCSSALGFFMFSSFLKESLERYVEINFVEEVLRWRRKPAHGPRQARYKLRHAKSICKNYLMYPSQRQAPQTTPSSSSLPEGAGVVVESLANNPLPEKKTQVEEHNTLASSTTMQSMSLLYKLPPKTEIDECDLERAPANLELTDDEFQQLYKDSIVDVSYNAIGLKGPVVDEILSTVKEAEKESNTQQPNGNNNSSRSLLAWQNQDLLAVDLFNVAEALVMEHLYQLYWTAFVSSPYYARLLNFLWFQDRRVVPEDFFTMRVLGRGGFGLVTACKKGTSGKLYAMKIMSKKRIKMKKAQGLALNERAALAAVQSPFVVNLKYSFHSSDDVFLILDLMAGGDLGFHLHTKTRFPKRECVYYAARIMLGLQALHDEGYVYRDLKPENCLLAEDGRVKLTDFGLATKVTSTLHGAAGTRGYWAPEMLRRNSKGKRMPYGRMVDWFSFGCCVAEFISGTNPFRSEAALTFGRSRGKESKEKALDCATLEMEPSLDPEYFDEDAADFCLRLLDKNENTRLGTSGCEEIMDHPWFEGADWDSIVSDRKKPPFIPAKDVNAASQSEIGTFAEDKTYQQTVITEKDEEVYKNWDWTNPQAFSAEVIEFLIYERETGEPLIPQEHNSTCCCAVS